MWFCFVLFCKKVRVKGGLLFVSVYFCLCVLLSSCTGVMELLFYASLCYQHSGKPESQTLRGLHSLYLVGKWFFCRNCLKTGVW